MEKPGNSMVSSCPDSIDAIIAHRMMVCCWCRLEPGGGRRRSLGEQEPSAEGGLRPGTGVQQVDERSAAPGVFQVRSVRCVTGDAEAPGVVEISAQGRCSLGGVGGLGGMMGWRDGRCLQWEWYWVSAAVGAAALTRRRPTCRTEDWRGGGGAPVVPSVLPSVWRDAKRGGGEETDLSGSNWG